MQYLAVQRKHSLPRVLYRYLTGRPLSGEPAPYLTAGHKRWPGWKRQAVRMGVPALAAVTYAYPGQVAAVVGAGLAATAYVGRRRITERRFTATYVAPTVAAITPGLPANTAVRLHVDPSLGSLTPRLAKPLSPAEEAARRWYGEHVEPVLRWLPDQTMRGWWAVSRPVADSQIVEAFRRPGEQLGQRIELSIGLPHLAREQRQAISAIISDKIPVGDLQEQWMQVGPRVVGRWTVRKRPPPAVGVAQVEEHFGRLAEWEFYIGQKAGDLPHTISLKDDSPHIAVSAGTGAGKSVLAALIAVQVLARGGQVVILDRKGSHRWALGLDGVDYCTKPDQMHTALVRLAQLADERNTLALHEDEDWDPGRRTLVICEELNATIGQLTNFWADARDKSDPKKSPAISALADLLFMGRSAKVNVLAIAQMLTARAIGGPEARENFGIRCLARYSTNNWKMLVPEASMPRSSRKLGRWQVVIGGTATEVQVAYLTVAQARLLATADKSGERLEGPLAAMSPGTGDMLTLRDAVDAGVLPWSYEAAKKRIQRGVGRVPRPRGKRGPADLYTRSDLAEWASSKR